MKLKDLVSKCLLENLYMVELRGKDEHVTTSFYFADLLRVGAKVYDPIAESEVLFICSVPVSSTRTGIYVQVRDPEVLE